MILEFKGQYMRPLQVQQANQVKLKSWPHLMSTPETKIKVLKKYLKTLPLGIEDENNDPAHNERGDYELKTTEMLSLEIC
jgi:hypothetical protein